jgi:integrase
MRIHRERYQHGSIRKVPRAHGFAWEFRFYQTVDGKRKLKVQTFDSMKYPTETAVRKAVEGQLGALTAGTLGGKVAATLGTIIDRYMREDFKTLRHSTQTTNQSLIDLHIRPKWEDVRLADLTAISVKTWIDKLPFGPASKARTRNMISKFLNLAMLWEYMPVARNPMELVKVKGSGKRQRKLVIITPDQLKSLHAALPAPYNLIVLVIGCMGYRISEVLALQWSDINWESRSIEIQRVFTHNQIQEVPKTDASGNELPLIQKLVDALKVWQESQKTDSPFVFASPVTGGPMSASTMSKNYLKPTALRLGIKGIGFHAIRHSYKSWMAAAKVNPAIMKDLMRHADFQTTMDVYGNTLTPELREANELVAGQLF